MVRTEQRSGCNLERPPEFKTVLDFILQSDTLVATRVDRPARSFGDQQAIVTHLKSKGALPAATERPADIFAAAGKAFSDMLGAFAKFETNLGRERRTEGIARIDVSAENRSPAGIARDTGISRGTVYKAKAECPQVAKR